MDNHKDTRYMKNQDIITLVGNGILAVTAHDIPAAHAYKVLRFKKAVREAFANIQAAEKEMFSEMGIDNTSAFNARLKELRETLGDDTDELDEMENQVARVSELQAELRNEDVALDGVKPMPYDIWHDLQNENKAVSFADGKKDLLTGWTEDVLENILWVAPEDVE